MEECSTELPFLEAQWNDSWKMRNLSYVRDLYTSYKHWL